MLDKATVTIQDRSALMSDLPQRRYGRLTLDMRQQLSPWKQSGFLAASLAIGLAIAVAVLAVAGVAPSTLMRELADTLNADSLRAVLVQAAPLLLVGLGASVAFRIGFWNLGLEGQMIFGGIAATGVSIYAVGPDAIRPVTMGIAAAVGGALWVLIPRRVEVSISGERDHRHAAAQLRGDVFPVSSALRRVAGFQDGISTIDAAASVRAASGYCARNQQRAADCDRGGFDRGLAGPSEPRRLLHAFPQRQCHAWPRWSACRSGRSWSG